MNAILWIQSGSQPMAQVLDRPLIQHTVEQLVERGIRHITLLHNAAEANAAAHLGNGERWGVTIAARVVPAFATAADFAAVAPAAEAGLTLVGNASRVSHLPRFDADPGVWNTLYFDEEDGVGGWSGWALLQPRALPEFAARAAVGVEWRDALRQTGLQARKVFLDHPSLSAATPRDILMANRTALDGRFPGLFFTGREKEPGVWIGRGAHIAATARLHAPCYIGEDAWIGPECVVGPYSVIAPLCVIESGTSVIRSTVGEGTFLGPDLEVSDSSVNHNRIHNVRLNADLVVGEEHVASALAPTASGSGLFARSFRNLLGVGR